MSAGRGSEVNQVLLEDKVMIVSGVGPGLGRHIAVRGAREGARCVLAARTQAKLDAVADEIAAGGGRAVGVACDITDAESCRTLVDTTLDEFGRIDVLVNNAFRGPSFGSFTEGDLSAWRKAYEVNVIGSMQLTQMVAAPMTDAGGGSIVFVNSMAARLVPPGQGDYAASKAALLIAAQGLARELGPSKIRVNSVVPGWMWGPGVKMYCDFEAKQRGCDPGDVYDEIAERIPLGVIPTDADCAGAVLFFASELAGVITGQTLDVNGGEYFG